MNIKSADAVRTREVSAVEVTQAALLRINAQNHQLNCFTAITAETALIDAAKIEQKIPQGRSLLAQSLSSNIFTSPLRSNQLGASTFGGSTFLG